MIALDPDFVGSLAPPAKLTTAKQTRIMFRLRVFSAWKGYVFKARQTTRRSMWRGCGVDAEEVETVRWEVLFCQELGYMTHLFEKVVGERDRSYRSSYDPSSLFSSCQTDSEVCLAS